MTEISKAKFRFEKYLIEKTTIEITDIPNAANIVFGFSPSGTLDKTKKLFQLKLGTHIFDEKKSFNITVNASAEFIFEDIEDENLLHNFLYKNAPAILFPYIRAYIASLSSLSGIPAILLPTINMSSLTEELKTNTKIIE